MTRFKMDESVDDETDKQSRHSDHDRAQTSSDCMTEDQIDQLKMPQAVERCKMLDIDISAKPKLREMRWMIKKTILCKSTKKEDVLKIVEADSKKDQERRAGLIELYENTETNLEEILKLEDPIVDELVRMGHGRCDLLKKERKKLQNIKAPILVLGETGSGKSFFINVLLGENFLPCSMLSNTHVVSEIRYSESPKAILYSKVRGLEKEAKLIENLPTDEFKQQLAEHVQKLEDGKAVYSRAEIFLPCPILKCGLMIVDSPGVGENEEMEDMVLDYVINACTFIYIIDSMAAGGVQMRMQELLNKVYEKALKDQKDYRPDSAIFVCNKWDMVPLNERTEVWQDTKRKILERWPDCKESQIFQFSALEADYIAERGGMSPKWECVLSEINKLLPLGREILLLKQYRFLEMFCHRCLVCLGAHLNQIGKSAKEREDKRKLVKDRLTCLEKDLDSFFDKETARLEEDIKALAQDLRSYLKHEGNVASVCHFRVEDLPKSTEWKQASVEVRSSVYGKIMGLISKWETSERRFKKIGEELSERLSKQFPKFDAEMVATQEQLSGSKSDGDEGPINWWEEDEEDTDLIPSVITDKFRGLSFGTKLALGLGLAPVILVTMAVRAPYVGFAALKKTFRDYGRAKSFSSVTTDKERVDICSEYAQQTIDTITDKMKMIAIIKEDLHPLFLYLKQQKQLMKDTIDNDLKLMETLKKEHRSDLDIQRIYTPLQAKFDIMQRCLNCFLITNFPEKHCPSYADIPLGNIRKIDAPVWTSATMYWAESVQPRCTQGQQTVSIRKAAGILTRTNVKVAKNILDAYRIINHKSIVKCFGTTQHNGEFFQVFVPLQCSVRGHFSEELRVNKENTCLRIIKDIVEGLAYLHDRDFVHFDLSLDTVYVDTSGNVKLTNINRNGRHTRVVPIVTPDGMVFPGKYVHINPKLFSSRKVHRDAKGVLREIVYDFRDDMYSVGIMMLELYKGQHLLSVTESFQLYGEQNEVSGKTKRPSLKKRLLGSSSEPEDNVGAKDHVDDFQAIVTRLVASEREVMAEETFAEPHKKHWCHWRKSSFQCLDGLQTAKQFQENWDDFKVYPPLSIVK